MYKRNMPTKTTINICKVVEGETIETKMERVLTNGEPISDGSQELLYTERKDGVLPGTDIRTDRFEAAIDAMDKVTASAIAKREQRLKVVKGGSEESQEGGDKAAGGEA